MKFQIFICAIALVILNSCGTSKSTTSSQERIDSDNPSNTITNLQPNISLLDYLRRISGVSVRGNGSSATILVRSGGNSINMSSAPLFLINGIPFGGSFSDLSGTVSVNDVKSVRVYKNASELAMYGVRGANGVIDIRLK